MLLLLAEADRSASDLAAPFSMSQPAISQHLKVLRDAGLVSVQRDGRERRYALEPACLKDVYDWLAHFERFWNRKLDALGRYLDTLS